MREITILAIADTHRSLRYEQEETLENLRGECDLILTLGDIPIEGLCEIQPDYGVLGNHDSYGALGTWDIHGKAVEKNGFIIAGFEGSSRYKDGGFPLYTQEESLESEIPRADILISHDCIYLNKLDIAHTGLKGISKYLEENKPILHLHGHHHKYEVYKYNETTVVSVYKAVLIKIKDGKIYTEQIFE